MAKRLVAVTVLAVALGVVARAAARTDTVPRHYTFSFSVAEKPDTVPGSIPSRFTGSGSGSFSIVNRQVDRDGTVFWDVTGAGGSVSLSLGGKVIVRGTVTGGHYGTEGAAGDLLRSVNFTLRITSATRFKCSKPAAMLGLGDLPQKKGNLDSMTFDACSTHLQFRGTPPKLVVHVAPA